MIRIRQSKQSLHAMKSNARKAPGARPGPIQQKSELWIQRELDTAKLNAKKNRLMKDNLVTRSSSMIKTIPLKPASDVVPELRESSRAIPTHRATHVSMLSCDTLKDSSNKKQEHPLIFNQSVEELRIGIDSLHNQVQDMFGEWGCAIKDAIFHEDLGLNRIQWPTSFAVSQFPVTPPLLFSAASSTCSQT
jgi:hypothetical protein